MFENVKEENVVEQTLDTSKSDAVEVSEKSPPTTSVDINGNPINYLNPNLFDDENPLRSLLSKEKYSQVQFSRDDSATLGNYYPKGYMTVTPGYWQSQGRYNLFGGDPSQKAINSLLRRI